MGVNVSPTAACVSFQLKKDEVKTYSVTLEEELPVRNLKPAVVKVYDYYQTSEYGVPNGAAARGPVVEVTDLAFDVSGDEAVTEYSSPCSEGESTPGAIATAR